jgi:hypothetical protein
MSDDWNSPAQREPLATGFGSLRIALLFGAGAIALALLVAPIVDRQTRMQFASNPDNLDRISTGSVPRSDRYTIRRSVLQTSPNSVCIIRSNGSRNGDC